MARLIKHRPRGTLTQQFQYFTNVQQSLNGMEYRNAVAGNIPSRTYIYEYRLDDLDAANEEIAIVTQFNQNLHLPVFIEEETTQNDSRLNSGILQGNYHVARLEYIVFLLEDGRTHQCRVTGKNNTEIHLDPQPPFVIPAGTPFMPYDTVQRFDNPQMARYPINFGDLRMMMRSNEFRALSGSSSFMTFENLPLLEVPPLNRSLVTDSYDNANEILQYHGAGKADVFSERLFPNKSRRLEFIIESRDDWEKWKNLINHASGMEKAFYVPTYRNDLNYVRAGSGGSIMQIDNGHEIVSRWKRGQHIFLFYDGTLIVRKVNEVQIHSPSELTYLELDTALPANINSATDIRLGFLEKIRLDNDIVEVEYNGNDFIIHMDVSTFVEPAIPLDIVQEGVGEFNSSFNRSFRK